MDTEDNIVKPLLSEISGVPSSLTSLNDIAAYERNVSSSVGGGMSTGRAKKEWIATASESSIRSDIKGNDDVGAMESPVLGGGLYESDENSSCIEKGLRNQQDISAEHEGHGISIPLERLIMFLYISHFLSRWGDRMWEFSVGLFMVAVWPNSLVLPALYGLVEAASVAVFGVLVGEWVDKFPRLKVAQISLGVQNGCIVTAAIAVVMLLVNPSSIPGGFKILILLVVLVNTFGAVGALAGLAGNILVERDWVVIIAEGQTPGLLTQMNAGMRRIDLSCKLLAPVAVGFLMSSVSILASAVLIAAWNAVSVGFEYWMLYSVYSATPALQRYKDNRSDSSKTTFLSYSKDIDNEPQVQESLFPQKECAALDKMPQQDPNVIAPPQKHTVSFIEWFKIQTFQLFRGWSVYIHQEAGLAAVALALLYFTVLSFGTLMTAFLQMRGVPQYILGLARGLAAAVGIGATFAYPILQARLHTIRTGIWSIWLQWAFLGICVASLWVRSNKISSFMLMGGVITSRLGLWMFDLSVTQIMQKSVPEAERGVVGGVQNSLQSFMDMLSYIIAVIAPRPQDFSKLVLVSFGVVLMAAILYSSYVRRIRGHLIHIDRFIRSR